MQTEKEIKQLANRLFSEIRKTNKPEPLLELIYKLKAVIYILNKKWLFEDTTTETKEDTTEKAKSKAIKKDTELKTDNNI